MILLLYVLLQAPVIPAGSVEAASQIDFHMGRVTARHNQQFVDAWSRYTEAYGLWWKMTQRNAVVVNTDGTDVFTLELLQATGQLKKAALDLLKEFERVRDRLDDLVDATKKAPPK